MKEFQDRDALMKKVQEECAVDKERIKKDALTKSASEEMHCQRGGCARWDG